MKDYKQNIFKHLNMKEYVSLRIGADISTDLELGLTIFYLVERKLRFDALEPSDKQNFNLLNNANY